jgi:hypothetical protein
MTAFTSLHKRKTLLLVILFIVFSAFTADILDLREELCILSCPNSSLDNNISTGLTSSDFFDIQQALIAPSVQRNTAVIISILYLLPYSFRAPPYQS